ncbi:hypothetical protein FIA56_05725 [Testudinibacter sp. TR-2022]|uniref:hypothetical protein n=1 Tax=Testudinibacter sp. TR-2022 TaxID=2585029 RepID=UPI00111B4194|nr:hypothetical protein [Testudinibacter sp. TR-2022]TNH05621.1 hypothetical protein FHQ22_00485 [Pasteurellaceae bacterium Phil31]TNH06725.1 hypothetical protein FHQ30_06820 [Pasteurellaceae bacterium Phil11]TNH10585.1 hypothetical protein FHQ25_04945 [Testudinibacter sp. TR-2022]TNH14056.1 hypothetical protein FIA56_05725 [Testudinibacter sp. TR-2022]TNH19288.1 hypothetical protein FHQ23_03450 [Testudinibacter sp. TR-2022]
MRNTVEVEISPELQAKIDDTKIRMGISHLKYSDHVIKALFEAMIWEEEEKPGGLEATLKNHTDN